ncbi:hypothetical protein ACOZ4J_13755 [Pseudomonas syringae pv. actinidiae]|uniref:hypothetical protein n=1 Tax=Pseudomonas syringae TaxID=317 RepID=UPI003DAA2DA5
MNARVHIGDLVTVDEASEAVDAKITSLPGDFVPSEEQDLELSIGIPGVDDPPGVRIVVASPVFPKKA